MNPLKLITKPIGCLCTLIGALILGLVLLGVLGILGFNHLAPDGVREIVENRGGFPVTVDEAGWDIFDSAFVSEDIHIQNPPNFPEQDFLHLRTLSLGGDPRDWVSGEVSDIESVTLEIDHINWVTTEGGSNNVALFAQAINEKNDSAAEPSPGHVTDSDGPRVQSWRFKIGTVEVADYSRGPVKREKHFIDREWRFENGESAGEVVSVISKDLERQGLGNMMHTLLTAVLSVPDIDGLKEDLNPAPDWLRDKLKSGNE